MKKILILLAIICFCRCTSSHQQVESSNVEYTSVGKMQYIMYDGHEYLIWNFTVEKGGICHSPKCPCLEQYKSK